MPLTDYNKRKKLSVDSVSGTPTVDKAQPILLSGGDDSNTGNGDIVIDFTNVSDAQDLAVYDQNGNLLDYEIESLDTTDETGVLWVYNSWTRDDTVQAQIAYGSNSSTSLDRQNVNATWSHTGQNAEMVQHLQDDPLTATDSTPNNNDGTVNGATATTDGEFDGAGTFDDQDDVIDIGSSVILPSSEFTVVAWAEWTGDGSTNDYIVTERSFNPSQGYILGKGDGTGQMTFVVNEGDAENVLSSISPVPDGNFVAIGTYNSGTGELFINESTASDTNNNLGQISEATPTAIGAKSDGDGTHRRYWDGMIDAVRLYSDEKSSDWKQAEFDAGPTAGQVFFSQQSAEPASGGGSTVTVAAAESLGVSDNRQRFSGRVFSQVTGLSADTSSAVSKVLGEGFAVVDAFRATGPLTGTVTLNDSPVEGAVVYAFNNTKDTFVGSTTTDVNGRYAFPGVEFNGDEILIAVDHDTGSQRFGDEKSTVV